MLVNRNVKKEILENGIVKKTFDLYNDGGCQCFKDCNCYLDRGIVQKDIITYNNCLTLDEALFRQKQSLENKERLKKDTELAKEWANSMTQKELFKIITNFKQQNKSLKRFNHHEISTDKILNIFYWWKKRQQE